jgi:hypothetical protein
MGHTTGLVDINSSRVSLGRELKNLAFDINFLKLRTLFILIFILFYDTVFQTALLSNETINSEINENYNKSASFKGNG